MTRVTDPPETLTPSIVINWQGLEQVRIVVTGTTEDEQEITDLAAEAILFARTFEELRNGLVERLAPRQVQLSRRDEGHGFARIVDVVVSAAAE